MHGRPVSAGLFWRNPQFSVTITSPVPEDRDHVAHMVVSLIQECVRYDEFFSLGIMLYKVRIGRVLSAWIRSPYQEKISDIYFLCSVSLSDFIAIQPSILVFCSFFFKFHLLFYCSCTYQFIHCIVYCCLFVCLPCVVLFGLMATRLNKHYY